jgi:hypothetical protein
VVCCAHGPHKSPPFAFWEACRHDKNDELRVPFEMELAMIVPSPM